MLERLKSSYLALSPRYRRLVGVALILAVLLVLHRTVVSWVLQYDAGLNEQIESAENLLQKANEKIASKPALLAKRQALQARMAQEYEVILPYSTSGEAGNFIISCLHNLASTAGISLKTVQTKSVSDLGTNYQKIEVVASTTALTQDWTRFLHEVETLRDEPPSTGREGECGPLPLTVEELTVRPMTGKNQHGANLMFDIAGIIRKPTVTEAAPSGQQPARNRD